VRVFCATKIYFFIFDTFKKNHIYLYIYTQGSRFLFRMVQLEHLYKSIISGFQGRRIYSCEKRKIPCTRRDVATVICKPCPAFASMFCTVDYYCNIESELKRQQNATIIFRPNYITFKNSFHVFRLLKPIKQSTIMFRTSADVMFYT
jgi:hypothetical protein